jgi:hypothetical protein
MNASAGTRTYEQILERFAARDLRLRPSRA